MRTTGTDIGGRGTGGGGDSLATAFSRMFSGTLVSRILGMVRTVLLVAALGATGSADAFGVANNLPTVIYNLLAGGVLNAVLVPQIVRAMKRRTDDEFVNRLLTMAGMLLFLVTLVAVGMSTVLVTIYAKALPPQWSNLAVAFSLYCLPQIFFYGMYALLGNVLNARGSFGPYMWAPVVNNVVAIAGLLGYIALYGLAVTSGADRNAELWDAGRIAVVGIPATLGVALQAAVLVIPLRRSGFRFRAIWGLRGSGLKGASTMAMWTFGALLVGQLGYIMVSNVGAAATAHTTDTGEWVASVTAYNSAFGIYMLPQSLVTTSLVTALFTRMSANAADRDGAAVREDMSFGLRTVGVFSVFATACLLVLAVPTTQAVVPSVPPQYAPGFAAVLVGLSIGIPGQAIWSMVQRVSYAYEDARTIFWIQVPMALVIVASGFVALQFGAWWWMPLQTFGISLSNLLGAVVGYLALRRKLPSLDGARVLRTYLRVSMAVLPAALLGWGLLHLLGPVSASGGPAGRFLLALIKVALVGTVMLAVYVGLLRYLRVAELDAIAAPVVRLFHRLRGAKRGSSTAAPTMGEGVVGPRSGPAGEESAVLSAQSVRPGALLDQRFRLDELRATTPTGAQVWSGHDTVLERPVTAVVVAAGAGAAVLDAARRAALIQDARFARIVDIAEPAGAGLAYVISETPEDGVPLAELAGAVDEPTARAIVGETAAALESARRRGVHHGRLGPDVVTVSADGVVISGLAYLAAAHAGAPESEDPVETSIARSQSDAAALVRLHQYLLGGDIPAEVDAPANAGQVIRSMAPWGTIALPAASAAEAERPRPPWDQPQWDRVRSGGADDDGPPAPSPGPPARDPSVWAPQPPEDVRNAPEFSEVLTPPAGGQPPQPAAHAAPAGSAPGWKVLQLPRDPGHSADPDPAPAATDPAPAEETAGLEESGPNGSGGADRTAAAIAARKRVAESLAAAAAATVAVARSGTEKALQGAGKAAGATARVSDKVDEFVGKHDIHVPGELPDEENARLPFSRRAIDPGPFVIALTVVGVVVVTVVSLLNLMFVGVGREGPSPTPAAAATVTAPAASAAPAAPTEPAPAVDPAVPPAIADIGVLDPQGDGAENPELTPLATDGDPETYWRSRSYVNPSYGMKEGIGLAVNLEQPAVVTEIELTLQGTGGHVQVKADPDDPLGSEVLAEADMGPTTVIRLPEPTEMSTVVLWFTSLPRAESDGKNRVELGELAVR